MRTMLTLALALLCGCSTWIQSFNHHDDKVRRKAKNKEARLDQLVDLCDTLCVIEESAGDRTAKEDDTPDVIRVDGQDGERGFLASLEIPSLITLPIGLLMEAGRWVVLEDADSFFGGLSFDNYLVLPRKGGQYYPPIQPGQEFEVRFRYMAIDNFQEGRLRDSWGGNGGEVSLQASMHALSDQGKLLRDDIDFLVTEEVKRRSPVLAALRATERGREAVERIEGQAREVLDKVDEYQSEIDDFIEDIEDMTGPENTAEARKKVLNELRDALNEKVSGIEDEILRSVARFAAEEIHDRAESLLQDANFHPNIARFEGHMERLQGEVALAAAFFDRYGVDEAGLFEQVEIIRGLADADHVTSLEFEGVRPKTFQIETDARNVGTAEIKTFAPLEEVTTEEARYSAPRSTRTPEEERQRLKVADEGLIYRGTLEELTELEGDARGFSLSVLMLERDSDKVAQALRSIEQYASDRDIELGSSGIEASAVAEALAIVAEKIAEDDVELKCLDLRFSSAEPTSGGAAGKEIFQLRPCTIVVGRNVDLPEFGAIAVIDIRALGDAAGS